MTKKTAMQRYIDYLEDVKERDNIPSWIITTAKNCLEPEKQQIIEAAKHGADCDNSPFISADDYFDKTYKQWT